MRIYFITGFGEDAFIFDRLRPGLPGVHQVLSLWELLPDRRVPGLAAAAFARQVADRFGIGAGDVVIGHSTGAWLAPFLKQACGCHAVQVAGWTDPAKVIVPVRSRHLIYFLARSGFLFSRFLFRRSMAFYRGKPSAEVFRTVFLRLRSGNRANVVNQLRLIFNPTEPLPPSASPDLRIHARKDGVIRYPDEAFCEVPGDHFSVYTYPDEVRAPILRLLNALYADA